MTLGYSHLETPHPTVGWGQTRKGCYHQGIGYLAWEVYTSGGKCSSLRFAPEHVPVNCSQT